MNGSNKKTKYLSTKQVSEYLGLHPRTIQRLAKKGIIKSIRLGKLLKYSESDIKEYLENGTGFSREPARKSDNPVERRAFPRINCSIPCNTKVIIPQKKEVRAQARILNISEGGVFLENLSNDGVFLNIRNDDPINIRLELDKKDKLEVNGRILRCTTVGGTQDNRLAVKFRNIPEDVRNIIANYVG